MEWNIMEKEGSMPEFTAGPGGTILPNPLVIRFSCGDFQDSDRDYCKWEIAAPGHNFRRRADFLCEGIQFQSTQEWFLAPAAPDLLVFRQTLEASENCVYTLETAIDTRFSDGLWDSCEPLDVTGNFCGMVLRQGNKAPLVVCETTQIAAASVRVSESRDGFMRSYQVTAWKEIPVKLEKYISLRSEGETEWFPEAALAECRNASKLRYDALQKGACVTVTDDDIEKLKRTVP